MVRRDAGATLLLSFKSTSIRHNHYAAIPDVFHPSPVLVIAVIATVLPTVHSLPVQVLLPCEAIDE